MQDTTKELRLDLAEADEQLAAAEANVAGVADGEEPDGPLTSAVRMIDTASGIIQGVARKLHDRHREGVPDDTAEAISHEQLIREAEEKADTRGDPQLNDDYYDDLFIVVDDDGEPVGPYHMTLKRAREYREDHGGKALKYRIAKLVYRALPNEDGPDEIVDDPLAAQ